MKPLILTLILLTTMLSGAIEIKGTISDESGNPVSGSPVFLVMERKVFNIRKFRYETVESKTISTTSDNFGLYHLNLDVDPYFNHFTLVFYGEGFDYAQFLRPKPEDISDAVQKGQEVVVNRVLSVNPLWHDLQLVLEALPKDAQKYRILRAYGFPERREARSNGTEVWYYFDLKKTFTVPVSPAPTNP